MGATFPLIFDATFSQENWIVDGSSFGQVQSEIVTPTTLTLQWRVTTAVLTDALRPLKSDEGKVNILRTDDGGFTAVDRANGGNTFELEPPERRKPLRQTRDYHVNRYEEDLISQDVGEWDVEVEFAKAANRTDGDTGPPPADGAGFPWTFDQAFTRADESDGKWILTTPANTLYTDRVDADFLGTGKDGVKRFELTVRLDFSQSQIFESEYAKLAGGRVRDIPDATNVAVDDTSGSATLTIKSPVNAVVPAGKYVIIEPWESTRISEAYQSISTTVAKT